MECNTSRLKVIGFSLMGAVFLALTKWYFFPRIEPFIGWSMLAIFAGAALFPPFILFRRDPVVVIDDQGIEDKRLQCGVIEWEDIIGITFTCIDMGADIFDVQKYLCIEVEDPQKYMSRLPAWKRWILPLNEYLGLSRITIRFIFLYPGIQNVWDYLNDNHRELLK